MVNIFDIPVREYPDAHVYKMGLESVQIMCTVLHSLGYSDVPYKPINFKHPVVLWCGESSKNYEWLRRKAFLIFKEHQYRKGTIHSSKKILELLPGIDVPGPFTRPPLCMPDECKAHKLDLRGCTHTDRTESFHRFYLWHKSHFLTFTRRIPPDWMIDGGRGLSIEDGEKITVIV